MRKIGTAILFLCLYAGMINAQVHKRSCGANEVLNQMIRDNPSIAITRQAIEDHTATYISSRSASGSRASFSVTIPVVVHILYSTAAQNISDAQIQSQIAILNEDYNQANSDWPGTPAPFQNISGNSGISFCLAHRDPNGNATTGIIRKFITSHTFNTNNDVKYAAQGGDDAWPAASYLNLWVCDLGSGMLGYSQFPGGAAATDGVVINYIAFGNTGTVSAPYDKGRTTTHEVGHWLNLYHIWGDDNGACTGTDHVDDTPNQEGENFGCPLYPHVSCSNGPDGDMFMNYMDYVDDACMFMFSAGQAARMQSLFAPGGARASLASSAGCSSSGAIANCLTPSGITTGTVSSPSDTIAWSAVTGATSYIVQYKPSSSSVWATATATSPAKNIISLTPGTTYEYQVEAVCAAGISTYSSVKSFITTTAVAACSDTYEPNESRLTAKQITVNSDLHGMINTAGDKDYFTCSNSPTQPNIKITLSELPADYDLKLYGADGSLLFTSENNGTAPEDILYNNAPIGTYYIYVYGNNNVSNSTECYSLKASISNTAWKDAEQVTGVADLKAEVQYNVYPNPGNGKFHLMISSAEVLHKVTARVVDLVGNTILTQEYDNIEGLYSFEINLQNAETGVYNVIISDGRSTEVRKIIVQR